MGPIKSFTEFAAMLRRRRATCVGVMVLGIIATTLFTIQRPQTYEATATVQIAAPRVADGFAPSTSDDTPLRRLLTAEQQLMTRASLLELVETHGLFAAPPALTDSEKAASLRDLIRLADTPVGSNPGGAVAGLAISTRLSTPDQARDVANALADRLVDLGNAARLDRSEATLDFFTEQEQALAQQIEALEDEISEVRKRNETAVPGGLQFRRVEISAIQQAIIDIDRERMTLQTELEKLGRGDQPRVVQRRMEEIRDEIASLDTQKIMLEARSSRLARSIGALPDMEQQMARLESQLLQLQNRKEDAARTRAAAEAAHQLEVTSRAERLLVIEPAIAPDRPVGPGRYVLAAGGVALSVLLAILVAFLQDLRHPAIRTRAQMERETSLIPLVSIPYFQSPHEASRPHLGL
ncbi:hypothetical protein [Pseudoruegeria sp. HB172150]|uniref:hypothetical protein n=1 Tax=Pseudoruegeria sp. HB172150 TaxID=2721164 RepID=UPI0015551043|nr:hypothetical protein [Pseudoruegeria sp. HB172150]